MIDMSDALNYDGTVTLLSETAEDGSSIRIDSTESGVDNITVSSTIFIQYGGEVYVLVRAMVGDTIVSYAQSAIYTMSAGSTRSVHVTVTGLEPGTEYDIRSILCNTAGQIVADMAYGVTTLEDGEIAAWSWNASNGEATAEQTQKAYTAIKTHGPISDFSYLVWNDMVEKAKAAVYSRGDAWFSDYAIFAATLMQENDRAMTATRFNSLRWNLEHYIVTDTTEKSPGDPVLGNDFILLAEAINNTIR